MLKRIHHIDFVVHDLRRAAARYAEFLGRPAVAIETLESRGVELARFDLDGIWIILVQPIREDSPVRGFLDRHGEGFFHIGYEVDDVVKETVRLQEAGIGVVDSRPRTGVEGWQLVDIDVSETAGVTSQLIQERVD